MHWRSFRKNLNKQKNLCFLLYFKHFEIERLYSVKHLYPVNLCESPRTTFITVEQGRGKAAAVYHILHSPSPTRHYEINASVTMKNILMWSRKQQISDSRNMKTDCIKTSNWKHKYCFHVISTSCSSTSADPRHIDLKCGEGAGSKNIGFIPTLKGLVAKKRWKQYTTTE
jgi:hypothetical protein